MFSLMDIPPVAYLPRHDAVLQFTECSSRLILLASKIAEIFLKQSIEEASTPPIFIKRVLSR